MDVSNNFLPTHRRREDNFQLKNLINRFFLLLLLTKEKFVSI